MSARLSCTECDSDCQECKDAGECKKCDDGYYLTESDTCEG